MVPLIAAVGLAYYLLAVRGRERVLSEHSAPSGTWAEDQVPATRGGATTTRT
jgi:hypothetical protein